MRFVEDKVKNMIVVGWRIIDLYSFKKPETIKFETGSEEQMIFYGDAEDPNDQAIWVTLPDGTEVSYDEPAWLYYVDKDEEYLNEALNDVFDDPDEEYLVTIYYYDGAKRTSEKQSYMRPDKVLDYIRKLAKEGPLVIGKSM